MLALAKKQDNMAKTKMTSDNAEEVGSMDENEIRGLTVVFTGDGKGKTSAALGGALRCLGHGYRVKVIQFIKGEIKTGELRLAERLKPDLDITQAGRGFTWLDDHSGEEHKKAAGEGFEMALKALESDEYKTVVLDEIFYALQAGLVTEEQISALIDRKPPETHLVLTGRAAPESIIVKADLVTSMQDIKHPSQKGIPAQKGMDY